MVNGNSTNSFIPFWEGSQVLSGHFIKTNLINLSFHLVNYGNLTEQVIFYADTHQYVETLVKYSF